MKTVEEILKMTKEELLLYMRSSDFDKKVIECSRCSDCCGCSRCSDCSNCYCCSRCYGCSRCSYCSDCSRCSYCSDCSRCSDCYCCMGVANLKYAICNVVVTKEEYEIKMKELKGTK